MAFDPKPRALGLTTDFTVGAAIQAGQVVAIPVAGGNWTVRPSTGIANENVMGVALYSQATVGAHVSVAGPGCVVLVQAENSVIAAGRMVSASGNIDGCVVQSARLAQTELGVALENIAANQKGYVLLTSPLCVAKGV